MLVLTRSEGASCVVEFDGVSCEVVIVRIDDNKVRVGFRAPDTVLVRRSEIDGSELSSRFGSESPTTSCLTSRIEASHDENGRAKSLPKTPVSI